MRSLFLVLCLGLVASPAFASGDCHVDAGPNDRVAKGHDVVIGENEWAESAVAIEGNVIIRKGAHVKNAVALHGSVTVEAGAIVDESVVAFGGKTRIDPAAQVKGSVVALDKGLHIRSDEGKDFSININVDGESLGRKILNSVLKDLDQCVVEDKPTK